jgi:polyisoprenyl-phosphate glycosyltransferase
MDSPARALSLDLVIPIYNEAEVLELLFRTLHDTFSRANLDLRNLSRVRYLFVDDGSSDRSAQIILEKIRAGAPAVLFRLSRNFGHANAICAGLDHASADLVAFLDADLQDPPAVVLEMVDKARDGYNVVFGLRRKRKENVFKRTAYWTFYRLVALLSDIKIPLDSGDFCLLDHRVVNALRALPEKLRYPRVLRAWVGFRQTGLEYDRPRRQAGESKYTFVKLYRLATDGIASASIRPLKIAQFSSFLFGVIAVGLALILVVMLWEQADAPVSHPLLLVSMLVTTSNALIMLVLYVFSAYLGRMYLELKGRPTYIVMERIEGSAPEGSSP